MSEGFSVVATHRTYDVVFGDAPSTLAREVRPGDIVLFDANVRRLYPRVAAHTPANRTLEIQANERAKTYEAIGGVIERIVALGFSRTDRLIAIGGGVIQDITAFAASILFRGVDWLFFPTNLLSQCDSCIGSKTSVNLGTLKNQLGGFHPPCMILIDSTFRESLGSEEIRSGLGEMLHYFLVHGVDDLAVLDKEIRAATSDDTVLASLIHRSLLIKREMIQIDEFDRGPRNVFNYGHTFGHALESVTQHAVPHGIAVAYGMDLANVFSARTGLIDMRLRNAVRPILSRVWAGSSLPDIDTDDYFRALSRDKKNEGADIKVILTKGLGEMFKTTLGQGKTSRELVENFFTHRRYEESL